MFKLNGGSEATDYVSYVESTLKTNIYLNEPLRKVGNVADYIDFREQKIVRKVGNVIVNFNFYSYNNGLYLSRRIDDLKSGSVLGMSNKVARFDTFPGGADFSRLLVSASTYYYYVNVLESEKDNYINKMSNVNIIYELKGDKIDHINLENFQIESDYKIIFVDTQVPSSKFEITY